MWKYNERLNLMEWKSISGKILIYGAKSIALGVCRAVKALFPEKEILGFLVSEKRDNPKILDGRPVIGISDCLIFLEKREIVQEEITVLIGAPETVHSEIIRTLEKYCFCSYICIDWKLEEQLMEQYYMRYQMFTSLHKLGYSCRSVNPRQDRLKVFLVKNHKDSEFRAAWEKSGWMYTLQAGAGLTNIRVAQYQDNTGDNISVKNGNYCELTALYWIWKNRLNSRDGQDGYYGIFQYRRLLNIEEEDVCRILENRPDVILPFPTIHEPDIREHHMRYIREADWCAMRQALEELYPDYGKAFQKLLGTPYLYNYNIMIAKAEVLKDYCAWLFPILERTEVLSVPKGRERNDRYIGYLGENLMTLYFMYHSERLQIAHTGRVMLA